MKRFLVAAMFMGSLFASYASNSLFAGIYGEFCDPQAIGNACPSVCGAGVGTACPPILPCTAMFTGTFFRNLCMDNFSFSSCTVRPCADPTRGYSYSCGGAGLAPCDCPPPPGTC